MRALHIFIWLICLPFFLSAQETEPTMQWSKTDGYDNKITFKVTGIPPLEPIPGSRKEPGVKYLWLFGDGNFSFSESPVHIYSPTQYEPYDAEFFLTYTYTDTGKDKRKKGRQRVAFNLNGKLTNGTSPSDANLFAKKYKKRSVMAQTNQEAIAGEEFVAIVAYRNTGDSPISGTLDLKYNEQSTCSSCFVIEEAPRLNNGEIRRSIGMISLWENALVSLSAAPFIQNNALIAEDDLKGGFANRETFEFSGLKPGEVRNIFVLMKTDESMTDTSLTTHIEIKLKDESGTVIDAYTLPVELVSSHDPNSLLAANYRGRMDRKFMLPWRRNTPLRFRINFQNNGDGPASNVKVITDIPQKLDYTSLEVEEVQIGREKINFGIDSVFYYQAYPDSLVFHFRNIYLAGTGQSKVRKKDSRGHIIYTIKPGKKMPKLIKSRANIYFDSNEKIVTKRSKIRLKKITRFTLEVGSIFPNATDPWKGKALDATFSNKYIALGTSALLPKKPVSMDAYMRYSNTTFVPTFNEPISYTFTHLTMSLQPQVDVLPFLRVGIGLEGGVLLKGKFNETQQFSLFRQDNPTYGALRYGASFNVLMGRTKKTGIAIGASYYLLNDKLPVLLSPTPASNILEAQWHNGFRLFVKWKI